MYTKTVLSSVFIIAAFLAFSASAYSQDDGSGMIETTKTSDEAYYDKDGYNKEGFDREGYDRNGNDKNGNPRADVKSYGNNNANTGDGSIQNPDSKSGSNNGAEQTPPSTEVKTGGDVTPTGKEK